MASSKNQHNILDVLSNNNPQENINLAYMKKFNVTP